MTKTHKGLLTLSIASSDEACGIRGYEKRGDPFMIFKKKLPATFAKFYISIVYAFLLPQMK